MKWILYSAHAARVRQHEENLVAVAVEAGKFALYAWDGDEKFEAHIKTTYKATTRCIPFAGQYTDELMPTVEA